MIFVKNRARRVGIWILRRFAGPTITILLTVIGIGLPSFALAQNASGYAVQINGAGRLAPMLNAFLEISLHAQDRDVTTDELQRLAAAAPQQIRELMGTEGYFSPVIKQDLLTEGGRTVARFEIDPGPPTVVGDVDLRFTGAVAQSDNRRVARLRQQWSLKIGEVFRQADWNEAKAALLKNLLARDFPAARLARSEARIDPEKRTATLTIEADSGPAFTFGELQIQGLKRYPRSRIDLLNPIQPGEPYSQVRLNELQAQLQDSGYFKSVFATIDVDPDHPVAVPVRVDVNENERRRLALGGGFSTDTGMRLQAKFLDRNFLLRDWRLDSELRLDRKGRLLAAEVATSALQNGWLPGFGGRFERTDIAGEVSDKLRIDGRLSSPNKSDEQVLGLSYLAERQRVVDAPTNNRHALIASHTFTRRRLNDLLNPRRGYVASLELGVGLRGLLTEQSLGRVVGHVTWLQPWTGTWKTLVRAQFGQVIGASRTSVPGDLLFRTGGDQTVRGYAYNSLGVAENDAIVGGRVMALLSGELIYQITPQWGAAAFNDTGNAADRWRDFKLFTGTGVGARWRSPIGPVNLDLAYAHQTRKPRLHFSIGYGF